MAFNTWYVSVSDTPQHMKRKQEVLQAEKRRLEQQLDQAILAQRTKEAASEEQRAHVNSGVFIHQYLPQCLDVFAWTGTSLSLFPLLSIRG
jgi:hypothetical protein